ncbi:4-hydroxythreonine-4-phosphate dehydrogenase PdxA [Bdellovibrio sp. SKB1291214]|uniref:4-hydroxythreonine-4-phosphate dehydrogenase PdxA n=1 Tax=Bdellovibrio sp. SKB1291214 TaxID=1732569 RepID=UPI000B51831C|nr:4-hydroxythreonine-4-phosphate dehydrogenase PdxA [Bdellovibrio sp. SKB1291214]UYL10540.1 4-hydroxythreonine-4-phosphate dehydrogenase PdxA [Bdellovibrio sp. SKB1291214]
MSNKRIALTTGDDDGIGFEVTAKALHKLGPQKGVQFFLWRNDNASAKYLKLIDQKFKRIVVDDLEEALKVEGNYLVDICSDQSPAHWVEATAKACMKKQLDGMATAPLSKTLIKDAGLKDLGHTDILKRLSKTKTVHMGFAGSEFNVVLATGHLAISQVSKHISFSTIAEALLNADLLRKSLPTSKRSKPIGVLGLNPHSGEQGMIGGEELMVFPNLAAFAKEKKIPYEGPLVPDAAFFKENWKKYSVYLCLYHDQGLIPFKMIHGQDSGVHISLGIPFVRTSVDHGTAKDIFGKNKANPNSMIDAIRWSINLTRQQA